MSNKNNELATAVYNELFPTADELKHELTRSHKKMPGKVNAVRNQQVLITSSDNDKS